MLSQTREERLIELCQELIRNPSVSGKEEKVAKAMKKAMLEEFGFDDVQIDKYGNVIGRIKGNKPGKSILFDGHIDTVPVNDESVWKYDPFKADIVEGKIYGRGASDMKGANFCNDGSSVIFC